MLIALNINNEAVVDCRVICRAESRPVELMIILFFYECLLRGRAVARPSSVYSNGCARANCQLLHD